MARFLIKNSANTMLTEENLFFSLETLVLEKLWSSRISLSKKLNFPKLTNFRSTDPESATYANINFNSYTTAPDVQINLELKLINKTKEIKGCLGAKILVYFVDDLNMQAPDAYGTQTTIELLRQIHDSGEVFDRMNCQEKKRIADVLLFGCQNPKAGSF